MALQVDVYKIPSPVSLAVIAALLLMRLPFLLVVGAGVGIIGMGLVIACPLLIALHLLASGPALNPLTVLFFIVVVSAFIVRIGGEVFGVHRFPIPALRRTHRSKLSPSLARPRAGEAPRRHGRRSSRRWRGGWGSNLAWRLLSRRKASTAISSPPAFRACVGTI